MHIYIFYHVSLSTFDTFCPLKLLVYMVFPFSALYDDSFLPVKTKFDACFCLTQFPPSDKHLDGRQGYIIIEEIGYREDVFCMISLSLVIRSSLVIVLEEPAACSYNHIFYYVGAQFASIFFFSRNSILSAFHFSKYVQG